MLGMGVTNAYNAYFRINDRVGGKQRLGDRTGEKWYGSVMDGFRGGFMI